jgi:thiamine-phosphate diphosphorylase
MPLPRLHAVTDDDVLADPSFPAVAAAVMQALGPHCALHLRGHATDGATLYRLGVDLAAAALASGSWLLVNDRLDVAMAIRANGAQLGSRSLSVADARRLLGAGAPIGISAHNAAEAAQASGDGADFVLLGTIWESASHAGRQGAGADALAAGCRRANVPVLAIGGVTVERVAPALEAGAYGVAVLGGIWHTDDAAAAAVAYGAALDAAWPEPRGSRGSAGLETTG